MAVDKRTIINDCNANTGWAGDDTASTISDAGQYYQGGTSLSTQLSNTDEHMYTTQDSVGAGTFSLDWSDSTLYLLVKDNLQGTAANGGVKFVIGDGTDRIGYDVGGNDAVGMPLPTFFNSYKLDVSVIVTTPGNFTNFAGTEANMDQTACTQIGYGSIHLAKAVGAVDNCFMDCFRYIANGSYALKIDSGTIGTPETMEDVAVDDVTNGWGMISNPVGNLYYFFAPTEWGESVASADHHFSANGEQWFWLGDNGGGHAVGATHFPMRVIGNATDVGSFVISNVVIVNTGTGAEFDCSNIDIDTLEIDTCTMSGLASFNGPTIGGTSRFCINTIFTSCGAVTANGANMSGCSILTPTISANTSGLIWNLNQDPNGELDNMVFSKTFGVDHHAIEFGNNIPSSITLTNCDFTGFSATQDVDSSIFHFKDTPGTITINLVNCTSDVAFTNSYRTDGATIVVVVDPATFSVTVKDLDTGLAIEDVRVLVPVTDGTNFPFDDSVTIISTGTTATVTHTTHGLATNDNILIEGADQDEYNGVYTITVTGASTYTYVMNGDPVDTATGTLTATMVLINARTNASGVVSDSRTYSGDQAVNGWARRATFGPSSTTATWTEATNTLTKTGAFTGMSGTFLITITAGTNMTPGAYLATWVDANSVTLPGTAGSADSSNVEFTIGAQPRYKQAPISDTIDSVNGLSVTVFLQPDE